MTKKTQEHGEVIDMTKSSKTSWEEYKGYALIVLGILFLGETLFNLNILSEIVNLWPVLLIVRGINILNKKKNLK